MKAAQKCLICGVDCDGSFPLYRALNMKLWPIFHRRVLIGELCRADALKIARPQIEEIEIQEDWMDRIK